MRPAQNPVVPLLVGGLVAVAVVALLSILAWVWAVRRPVPSRETDEAGPNSLDSRPVLVFASIVGCDLPGLSAEPSHDNWVGLIHSRLPEGTRLMRLGWDGMTLAEANRVEIPTIVEADPNIVLLWSVANDARKGVNLATYTKELMAALAALVKGTEAAILLPNLPDISLLAKDMTEERRALIRGGVQQWNRAMSDVAARYGKRVCLIDLYGTSAEILDMTSGGHRLAELVWIPIEQLGLVENAT